MSCQDTVKAVLILISEEDLVLGLAFSPPHLREEE